jgi:hypothetical protein
MEAMWPADRAHPWYVAPSMGFDLMHSRKYCASTGMCSSPLPGTPLTGPAAAQDAAFSLAEGPPVQEGDVDWEDAAAQDACDAEDDAGSDGDDEDGGLSAYAAGAVRAAQVTTGAPSCASNTNRKLQKEAHVLGAFAVCHRPAMRRPPDM